MLSGLVCTVRIFKNLEFEIHRHRIHLYYHKMPQRLQLESINDRDRNQIVIEYFRNIYLHICSCQEEGCHRNSAFYLLFNTSYNSALASTLPRIQHSSKVLAWPCGGLKGLTSVPPLSPTPLFLCSIYLPPT